MLGYKIHIYRSLFLLLLCAITHGLKASNIDDVSFPFKLVNGLIIFEAEIDGVEGSYMLDTGADAVMIDGQADADESNQLIATPNGDVSSAPLQVAQLKIGNFVQYEIEAQVISLSTLKKHLGIELDGIIGSSYFLPYTLIMDFEHSMITITSDPSESSSKSDLNAMPFKMVNQIPVVEIEIEGKTYDFALDSGASLHFIDQQTISKLKTLSPLEESSTVSTLDHSNESSQRFVLNRFKLGSINFVGHHCLPLDLTSVNETLDQNIAGILSLSKLTRNKVIIDFQNNLLHF